MKTFSSSGFRASTVDQMRLLDTVIFTSSGTFDPADYPGAGALRVWVQGGGGGGGGWTAASMRASGGGGGGGCVYSEHIKGASGHFAGPNTVTVGLGGAGGTLNNVRGSTGGTSSFQISGAGPAAYGGSGGNGYLNDYSFLLVGGGGTGHSGLIYQGGHGGSGKVDSGLGNCVGHVAYGVAGSGGIYQTSAAKHLGTNVIFRNAHMDAGANYEGDTTSQQATNGNTGNGGSGRGISCRPAYQGYGGGGDSGIVIVEVWG